MAYIYKIINDVNGKIYIGKTSTTLERRFNEHLRERFRPEAQERPLYRAMNKYGIEHFSIELIEETTFPEEREIYWIETLQSFQYGYNATLGGDGKPYADYDLIYTLYNQKISQEKISTLTGYDQRTIERALDSFNITHEQRREQYIQKLYKKVARIDKDTDEILEVFSSISEANKKYRGNNHISAVCKGQRKTAGGFKWKYI